MIFTKTQYKTHDVEFQAIAKDFKTWKQYLKYCKHEFLVLTDHYNFYRFINTKNLSFKQIC